MIGCPNTHITKNNDNKSDPIAVDAGNSAVSIADVDIAEPDPISPPPQPQRSAEEIFQKAIHLASSNPNEAITLLNEATQQNPKLYQAWYNIGVLQHRMADYSNSEKAYRNALGIKSDHRPSIINLVRLYLIQGQTHKALAFIEQKSRQFPDQIDLRNELISIYIKRGDYNRSEQMARAIQQKEERNAQAILNLGLIWYHQKKYELASSAFTLAANADQNYPEPHYYLGFAYLKLDRQHAAISALQQAIKRQPEYPEAHNLLGYIYLKQPGQVAMAAKHFRQALASMPLFPEAQLNLGIALKVKGQYSQAAEHFHKMIKQFSNYYEPFYYLGTLYLDHPIKQQLQSVSQFTRNVPQSLQHDKSVLSIIEEISRFYTAAHYLRIFITRKTNLTPDTPARGYLADAEKKLQNERNRLDRLIKNLERQRLRQLQKKSPPPSSPPPSDPPKKTSNTPNSSANTTTNKPNTSENSNSNLQLAYARWEYSYHRSQLLIIRCQNQDRQK
jgi:tetratricopeptide (TPR) repeat protein